jgi:hypothetical protein
MDVIRSPLQDTPDSDAAAVLLELNGCGTEIPGGSVDSIAAASTAQTSSHDASPKQPLISGAEPPSDTMNTLLLRGYGACLCDPTARVASACLSPAAAFTLIVDSEHAITGIRVSKSI